MRGACVLIKLDNILKKQLNYKNSNLINRSITVFMEVIKSFRFCFKGHFLFMIMLLKVDPKVPILLGFV